MSQRCPTCKCSPCSDPNFCSAFLGFATAIGSTQHRLFTSVDSTPQGEPSERDLDIEAGKQILLAAADEGAIDNFDDDDFVAVARKAKELFGPQTRGD